MEVWNQLAMHNPGMIGQQEYTGYSVIVPLLWLDGQYQVLLEVRSDELKKQPGEICLPGGRLEPGETYREAAVRETGEELLVAEEQIEVIADLDILVSPFNLMIIPFLAVLTDYRMTYSRAEVGEVFAVPLCCFLETEPAVYHATVRTFPEEAFPYSLIPRGREYDFREGSYPIAFYRFGGHVIWGMTARILASMAETMRKCGMTSGDCHIEMAKEVLSGGSSSAVPAQ